jgi:hypothetical protein
MEHRVDGRDLVAHKVRNRQDSEHHESAGAAEVVERLGEIDEVEPLRECAGEQGKPGIQAGGRGEATRGAEAGEIHGGSVSASLDGRAAVDFAAG